MPYLTQLNAQRIAERIMRITPYDINITDKNGIIIASRNKENVGKAHAGAIHALEMGEAYIVYRDGEVDRKGIHFPIRFNQNIEGILEVNGDVDEVMQVGQIVVTAAELMMENDLFNEIMATKENRLFDFFYEWTQRSCEQYDEHFRNQAEYFKVNLSRKRVAVMIHMERTRYSIVEEVRRVLGPEDYLVRQSMEFVTVLLCADSKTNQKIDKLMNISQDFTTCYISSASMDMSRASREVSRAKKIAELLSLRQKKVYYEEIHLESRLLEVEPGMVMEKLIRLLEEHDTDGNLQRTILVYVRNNEDQKKVCEELFIHRNTLNYRLDKIQNISGYNPRNGRDLMFLYLTVLHKMMAEKQTRDTIT